MTGTRRAYAGIEKASQIAALASPARIEIVLALEALGAAASVAELAAELGRTADGLYFHLRALVAAGLIERVESDEGQCYRSMTPHGQRMRMRYKPGAGGNAKAVARVAASMLRIAERDFTRALTRGDAVVDGAQRELWVARIKGWVGHAEVAEINRLLARLSEVLRQPRSACADKLVALSWVLAPVDAKPARRADAASPALRRPAGPKGAVPRRSR